MQLQTVSLANIVPNPWRDLVLYPINPQHIANLSQSIHDHDFFSIVKGRPAPHAPGKIEIGFGHARVAAARHAMLVSIPMFVEDIDDDTMLRLMASENALQTGSNAAALMNEVAAVVRRLITGLLQEGPTNTPWHHAFENEAAITTARNRLKEPDGHVAIGHIAVARYLGQGDPKKAYRSLRQIRESIAALKQCGRYDNIIEQEIRRSLGQEPTAVSLLGTSPPPLRGVLDERCASLFSVPHQFTAFREAVTTPEALEAIPVARQYDLAKELIEFVELQTEPLTAKYITKTIKNRVREYQKTQLRIDSLTAAEGTPDYELSNDEAIRQANAALSELMLLTGQLTWLAMKQPDNPKLAGLRHALEDAKDVFEQLINALSKSKWEVPTGTFCFWILMTEATTLNYRMFNEAYNIFNRALFDGELPECLITLQRRKNAFGFFVDQRFIGRGGSDDIIDEIALNPETFEDRTDREIASTLVHEMAHCWQHHFGNPGRGGYHNKEWASKMIALGLIPSDTGQPGGKQTGQRVSHYIDDGGVFDREWQLLETSGFAFHYQDRPTNQPVRVSKAKVRYSCPSCGISAWGKQGLSIACEDCQEHME